MMKNFKRTGFYLLLALAVLMLFASLQPAMGQPGGGGDPCPGGPPCDPDVPITGLEWLLAAGGALGIRAISARKRRSGQ